MIELAKYFRILFMSVRISRDRLKGFTEDHIQRLTANNPGGIFTGILTAILTAYNNFYGNLASKSVNEAAQEGKTIAMNESRDELEKNLSDNEKLIAYTYRTNKPFYEEFYPLGLTEYSNADLDTFGTITLRYKTVLGNHSADFPGPFVTEYGTKHSTFVTNRSAQSTAKSAVDSEISDMATTRPALAKQLTINVLTIALQYVGDDSKATVYFDQAILDNAFRESDRKVSGDINPDTTENIFDNISKADLRLTFKNTGEGALNFGFKLADDSVVTETTHQLAAGAEVNVTAAEWGWTSVNKFLNVTNASGLAGSYSVEKN